MRCRLDSELFIQGGGSRVSGIQLALGVPLASPFLIQIEKADVSAEGAESKDIQRAT